MIDQQCWLSGVSRKVQHTSIIASRLVQGGISDLQWTDLCELSVQQVLDFNKAPHRPQGAALGKAQSSGLSSLDYLEDHRYLQLDKTFNTRIAHSIPQAAICCQW